MRRSGARGRRAREQRGETLLELLVTVSIMGTAFVGVLAGIGATFMATDSHRQEATAETVLRNYAERVKDPTGAPYVGCATTAAYSSPTGFSVPGAGWTAAVTTALIWQGDTPPPFTSTSSTGKGLHQRTRPAQPPAGARPP